MTEEIKITVEVINSQVPKQRRERERANAKNFSRTEEVKPEAPKPDLLLG